MGQLPDICPIRPWNELRSGHVSLASTTITVLTWMWTFTTVQQEMMVVGQVERESTSRISIGQVTRATALFHVFSPCHVAIFPCAQGVGSTNRTRTAGVYPTALKAERHD